MPNRPQHHRPTPSGPHTLIVAGGKHGVGATTLAAKLATSLAQDALRVVLIDADLQGGHLATQCKLSGNLRLGDVLAGKKSIHEALQLGPAGIQVLAGIADPRQRPPLDERAIQRLLRQIASLAPHADRLIVDAGNQPSELALRLLAVAAQVLIVTSPHAAAITETYVLIKTLVNLGMLFRDGSLALAVNQADSEHLAADVHRRIDQSCRRFLGVSLGFGGWLPVDTAWASAVGGQADGQLADTFRQLADRIFRQSQPTEQRAAA
jgi:flagellar biosynthesis protein FlhG